MSTTPVKNLSIEAGTTYERTLRFFTDKAQTTSMNLTGYQFAAQIRNGSFAIDIGLAITNAVGGQVQMTILPEQTVDLLPGKYGWDMLITNPSGKVKKYSKGVVEILKTETRLA